MKHLVNARCCAWAKETEAGTEVHSPMKRQKLAKDLKNHRSEGKITTATQVTEENAMVLLRLGSPEAVPEQGFRCT